MRSIQERYLKSKGPLTRARNTFKSWLEYEKKLVMPTLPDTKDDVYLELFSDVNECRKKLKVTMDTISYELKEDNAEIARSMPIETMPKDWDKPILLPDDNMPPPLPGMMRPSKSQPAKTLPLDASLAYMEDMFIFQGNQIRQINGTEHLMRLISKMICDEPLKMGETYD